MKNNNFFKKPKNWLLILKNGLGIIAKFRIPSLIFLLITILFSLTISSFIEINTQLNNQINESGIADFKVDKAYSLKNWFLENQKNRNIFCNDFSELKINGEIKRLPRYSFGNDGCFKEIDKNEVKINYRIDKETNQILGVNNVRIDAKNFLINYDSEFYKNSLHQRLIQKYKETINIEYKNLSNKLIDVFLTNNSIGIKKILEENIKEQLNYFLKNNLIFFKKTVEKTTLNEININNIILTKNNKKTLNEYLKKLKDDTELKKELSTNKEFILSDWKIFGNLLQEIKDKKLDPIFYGTNTKEIKEEIKSSIGNTIKTLIILAKTNDNQILGFDDDNKLKLSDFNNEGEIYESSLNIKKNENVDNYLRRLIKIKDWVKQKEGKIKNYFETNILTIIKRNDKNDNLLLTESTKEILDLKIRNVFTKTSNTFKYFLNSFMNAMKGIEEQNNQKWKNYLLSNYSKIKKMINEKLIKNELINFWKKIKKIESLHTNLKIENQNIRLYNFSFNLNNVKNEPIKFKEQINQEKLNKYIKWLEYKIFIKNSIFKLENESDLKNYIATLNDYVSNLNENHKINDKDFWTLIPKNYKEFEKNYSKESYENLLEIVNKIEEKEYILNFWKNKAINKFRKLINWRKIFWFLFTDKENIEKDLEAELREITIELGEIDESIESNADSTKKDIYEFLKLWEKHNALKTKDSLDSLKNAKKYIEFGFKFLNKIYLQLFKNKFKDDTDLNIDNWSSEDDIETITNNAREIDKWLTKFSINTFRKKTDLNYDNIFDTWNLINLMTIQKQLISESNNDNDKTNLKKEWNLIKIELKTRFIEFVKSNSINKQIELLQIKPKNYDVWIESINTIWKKIYQKNNRNSIEEKINFIFQKNFNNQKLVLNEKIKKDLKNKGFDLNKKTLSLEIMKTTFFVKEIINNLINNSKIKMTKNLFDSNFNFIPNSNEEKSIQEKITEILLEQKNNKEGLGFENPNTFKSNYLSNIFNGKGFDFHSILKENLKKIEEDFNKYINENSDLNKKIKKIEFGFYYKKNKKSEKEIVGKFLKLTYVLENNEEDITDEEKLKLENELINWEKKLFENNVKNLNFWFNKNNIVSIFLSGGRYTSLFRQWENKKRIDLLHEIVAKINNIKYKRIYSTWVFDAADHINFLIVQNGKNDNSFKLHLIKGSAPLQSNEIVITPTFARAKNLKIGDTLEVLEQSFKIVGIGSQTPFIFPAGNWQNPLDVKENVIIFINSRFQNRIWWDSKDLKSPVQTMEYYHVFLEGSDQNIKNFEKDLLINGNSFTELTLKKNLNKNTKNYKIIDNESLNLKLQNFNDGLDNYKYSLLNQFVTSIKTSVNWTSIGVCLLIFFVWLFSAFNLVKRKIKESKLEFSFLKAQGVKGYEILFSYFGLLPPLFLAIVIGIFLGFFFQNPVFNQLQEYLSLKFDNWSISVGSFLGPMLIIPTLLISFIVSINWWTFEKREIIYLITNIDESISNFWEIKIKNFFIKKLIPKNKIMMKINLIFLLTVWKKTLMLFGVIFFFVVNLIGTIYLLRLPSTTIESRFKKIKYNYNIKLRTPASNNPFSFYQAYNVEGIKGLEERIMKNENLGLYPIEKLAPEIWSASNDDEDKKLYWKVGMPSDEPWKNFETFHTPLHGAAINFEYMKKIFNGLKEKNRKIFCEIITKNILKNQILNSNKDCLEKLGELSIPFKSELSKEIIEILRRHLPLSSQKYKYNKKTDILSTTILGKLDNDKEQSFKIIGVKENNYVFEHNWKTELNKPNKNGEINIVVNQKFLDQYKLKVGDLFEGKYKRKLLYLKDKKEPYKKEDWKYLPIGIDITNHNKGDEKDVWDWNKNAKFYKGSLVNKLKKFKVNKNTGQVKILKKDSTNVSDLTSGITDVGYRSSIQRLEDTNKYLVGTNDKGFWLLEFNDNGLVVQANKIQDKDGDVLDLTIDGDVGQFSLIQALGNNKYLVGTNNKGFWLLKFDDSTNKFTIVEKIKDLNDNNVGNASSIQILGENKYLVGTYNKGFWLLEFNNTNNQFIAKKIQGKDGVIVSDLTTDGDVGWYSSIQSLGNNKYLVGTGTKGFWLLKFNDKGLVLQANKIKNENGVNVSVLTADGYIGSGSSIQSLKNNKYLVGTNNKGFWLLVFNDDGLVVQANKIQGTTQDVDVLELTDNDIGLFSSIQSLGNNKYLVGTNNKGFWLLEFDDSTNKFSIANKIQGKDDGDVWTLMGGDKSGNYSSIQVLGENKYLVGTSNQGFWLLEFNDSTNKFTQVNKIQEDTWENTILYNKYYDERMKKSKYTKMIDIERTLLYQNKNKFIKIFLGNELKYGTNLLKKPRNWWEWNVRKKLYTKEEWVTPKINGEKLKFRITNKINTYEEPEVYIEQEKVNQIVGFGKSKENGNYVGDSQYFNSLYSKSENIIDAVLFGISISDLNGYFDIDVFYGGGLSEKLDLNINSPFITKNSIHIFLKYILRITLFSIILNIISSLFLLWFILKGIFEEFKSLTIDLKIIGYSNKELIKQIVIIITLPFILGFLFSSIITKIAFNNLILIAKEYNFYLFLDEDYWIFIVVFLMIFLCFAFLSWKYIQGFKKINFSKYLKI